MRASGKRKEGYRLTLSSVSEVPLLPFHCHTAHYHRFPVPDYHTRSKQPESTHKSEGKMQVAGRESALLSIQKPKPSSKCAIHGRVVPTWKRFISSSSTNQLLA
ncbi:hypothetical protein ECG_03544 [Echinococcus granulosus]|nr:hypothetical protein ECG_03544 [Echinococcus granulosus]